MSEDVNKIKIILFYDEQNSISINTDLIIKEYLNTRLKYSEISYETVEKLSNKILSLKYDISGDPTILFFYRDKLIKRWLGEITFRELDNVIMGIKKF